jgi:predicted DNA-binding protein YlxM (UPF0122 family)
MIANSPNLSGRKRVLTPEETKKVIRLYSIDLLTPTVIAKRFGVSQSAVRDVLLRENVRKPCRKLYTL